MFRNLKLNIVLISLIVIAILIVILRSTIHSLDKVKQLNDNLQVELKVKTSVVETYKNKEKQTVFTIVAYTKALNDLNNTNDSIEKLLYKTHKASKLKDKQIKHLLFISGTTTNDGVFDTVYRIKRDTIYQTIKYYDDGYLSLTVNDDSVHYKYTDSLIVSSGATLVKRKFFLWRWLGFKKCTNMDMIEVVPSNPKTKLKLRYIKLSDYECN